MRQTSAACHSADAELRPARIGSRWATVTALAAGSAALIAPRRTVSRGDLPARTHQSSGLPDAPRSPCQFGPFPCHGDSAMCPRRRRCTLHRSCATDIYRSFHGPQ
jgi:hypothetical protein